MYGEGAYNSNLIENYIIGPKFSIGLHYSFMRLVRPGVHS
jgi:hypothetical protein